MPNKLIVILQHKISYWYEDGQDMCEVEQEHVQNSIIDGYCEGELNDGFGHRGWWKIDRLEDKL